MPLTFSYANVAKTPGGTQMVNRLYILIITLAFLSACGKNTSPEQSKILIHQAIENGELNKALILSKNAILLNKNNGDLRVSLGKVYLALGNLDFAEKELSKAQELEIPPEKWLLPLIQVNYLQNEHFTISQLWQENKQYVEQNIFYEANIYYALSLLSQKERTSGLLELAKLANNIESYDQNNQSLASTLLKLMSPDIKVEDISQNIQELKTLADNNKSNWLTWLLLSKAQFSFKDFESAATSYEHLSQLLPNFNVAQIYAAESNIEAGNNIEANTQLENLLKLFPSQPYINLLFAKNSMMMKDFTTAKLAIEKTFSSNYTSETAKLIAGITYYQLGEYENAYSNLIFIAKSLPRKHPARKVLIATQIRLGYIENAYSELNEGNIDKDETVLVAAAAHSLLAANKTQQASELLNRLQISQAPTPALALELGKLKYMAGDRSSLNGLDEAIKTITSDVIISATDIHKARTMELASLVENKQLQKAKNIAENWINKEPKNIGNYLLLIEVMKRIKNIDEIDRLYKKTLEIDQSFTSAKLYFAAKDLSQNKYKKAIATYNEIIVLQHKNTKAIVGKYFALVALQKKDEADTFIQELLKQEGENSQLKLVLAKTHYKMGNIKQALSLLSDTNYLLNKDKIEKLNIIAMSNLKLGNKLETITAYHNILEITPSDTTVFTQKILTMEALGLYAEIITDIENFKTNLPYDDPSINLLHAEYLANANRATESLNILNGYKQTNTSKNPIYKAILGKSLYMLEDYSKAMPLLEKEYERVDSYRTATMLYNTYMRTQSSEKAIDFVKKHLLKHPKNPLFLNIHAEYLSNTDKNKSIDEYKKLLAIDNKNGIALNNIAWIYYERKEYEEAKLYIDQALEYYPKNKNILDTANKISYAIKANNSM
jgi:putative PEP-CTERM system TPR-repeat lipoprotein